MTEEGKVTGSVGRLLAIAIVVSAIAGGGAGYAASKFANGPAQPPQAREFWVFTVVLGFDDSRPGFPVHDYFTPDRIAVNHGDTVTIHFVNTEEEPENHTFTMDAPYEMDHEISPGEVVSFMFLAHASGVYTYRCRFHAPTMAGSLVVLGG